MYVSILFNVFCMYMYYEDNSWVPSPCIFAPVRSLHMLKPSNLQQIAIKIQNVTFIHQLAIILNTIYSIIVLDTCNATFSRLQLITCSAVFCRQQMSIHNGLVNSDQIPGMDHRLQYLELYYQYYCCSDCCSSICLNFTQCSSECILMMKQNQWSPH